MLHTPFLLATLQLEKCVNLIGAQFTQKTQEKKLITILGTFHSNINVCVTRSLKVLL